MATRFYFPTSGTPSVSPAFDVGWEETGEAARLDLLSKRKLSTTQALSDSLINAFDTGIKDEINRQFVSEPIPAQRLVGTVSLVVRCVENFIGVNAFLAVVVKVVSQDGGTARGTLFSTFSTDTEFGTTAATRIVNAQNITALTTQPGDRIVVEIGANTDAAAGDTFSHRFGTSASSDFALTSGLTTDLNPWIEFSQDIWNVNLNNFKHVSSVSAGVISTTEKTFH